MIVQDIFTPLYQEANQQFSTLLLGDAGIYNAIDMALCDIYTYEGNNWDFMFKTQEFTFLDTDPEVKDFTLDFPVTRVTGCYNLDGIRPTKNKIDIVSSSYDSSIIPISIATGTTGLSHTQISMSGTNIPVAFRSGSNIITLHKAGGLKQAIAYFGWFNTPAKLTDIIPVPNAFKACLRDLALHYILGPQGQYGEQKSGDLFNRGHIKLQHLAKSGLHQMSSVAFK